MAVAAADVAGVVQSATASAGAIDQANRQAQVADAGAGGSSGFDVWSHTAAGMAHRVAEDPQATDRAMAEGASGEWARTDASSSADSLERQASDALSQFQLLTGQREPAEGEADADGFLGKVGATFGILTSLEQMISAPLSMLPFPAFPAIRVTDMDVGLPHGHTHPPNVPPTPPAPFPSTGPIIPIPFLSGATTTLINGMPAARCGDMGLGVWCGGYFPMYEVFLGSSSVWIEGARAGRLLVDVTRHCMFSSPKPSDPPLGPMVGMTITSSPNVLIGGVPMPSLLDLAMGAAIQGLFKGLGKVVRKVKAARAARAARFADAADEVTPGLSRGSGGAGASLPRPLRESYLDRLLYCAGGNKIEALHLRAEARAVVQRMIDNGKIEILWGGDEFARLVKEDLYMMGCTPAGREVLARIEHGKFTTRIYPPWAYSFKRPGEVYSGPCAAPLSSHAYYDAAAGKPGLGSSTDVYYDPDTSITPNTPPDTWLNHEMGHAANNAEGMNRCKETADVLDQPHMTPEQRAEIKQDDMALDDRWTNKEEQNVIQKTDIPHRKQSGLGGRFGHKDAEGLNSSGQVPGRSTQQPAGPDTVEFEVDPSLFEVDG